MKKLLSIMVCVGVLLSLTACDGKTSSSSLNEISGTGEGLFGYNYSSGNGSVTNDSASLIDKSRVTSADANAHYIKNSIENCLYNADADGYGMKDNSEYVDRLVITIDSTGKWTVSGINPDHFNVRSRTTGDIAWDSTATATLGEEKSADMNPTKLFALRLAEQFPDINSASIYAVLVGGKDCTFVAYTSDTAESIADDVAADNLVAANGDPNKNSTWDSNKEGFGSKNGYIIGTAPKIPMA